MKSKQVGWGNKVPFPVCLAMIMTFTITSFFLEENDSKHIFTCEG